MELDNIKQVGKKIEYDYARHSILENEIAALESETVKFEDVLNKTILAKNYIQSIAKEVQEGIKFKISSIVSSALESVFPDPYTFKVDFVERRGKIEVDLLFVKNGIEFTPVGSSGGGPLDVSSFSLRLTYWFLKGGRPIMILDEPFKYVSVDLQPYCSAMLKMLSEKMGVQIIMVSHLPELINSADKVYTISNGKVEENLEKDHSIVKQKITRVKRN